jgi:PAS domain S-box-containing protein
MGAESEISGFEHAPDLPGVDCIFLERSPLPMVAVAEPSHIIRYCNPAFARLVGTEVNELVGRPFSGAVPEAVGNGCRALLDRVFRSGMPEDLPEQEQRHTQARPAFWSYWAWRILGADGRPAGVMIQVTDVTGTAQFHRRAADMNEALLFSSVRQHELVAAEESLNARLRESQDRLEARVAERTAELAAANASLRTEISIREAAEDELRATTQQLWQAARLAGLGELAAGIAHELNNPLATVSLRIEGLLARTPPDDPRRKPLEVIDQEVERMSRLVRNLLQFSRAGRDEPSAVNVAEEVATTVELIEHHLRKGQVLVESEFAPDAPLIYADRQQLRQVLLNLLINAADAMPEGGRLVLRVRLEELPGEPPAVVLEVRDTGVGIPPEHLARVTDPFFTTKEEGRGTGLGLAVCKRIIEQHQGALEIHSRVGDGTAIRVTLPVRAAADPDGSPPGQFE